MATTKSVSFACPKCKKVLRASARPPAGKKIKCPSCGKVFVPELDDEEHAASIQEKPRVKAAPSRSDDDEEERPRNKKARADENDEPRRKKRSSDDDDDEADEDDDRASRKKKPKKKSGSMMMWILGAVFLGGGGLLGCIGCGVGAYFFWPGSSSAELLAFVSPEANLLIGGRPKELKTKFNGFKDMFAQAAGQEGGNKFPEMEDLMLNSDQFLMFTNTNNMGKDMIAVVKAEAGDIERLKKSNRLEAAKKVGDHSIHRVKPDQQGGFGGGGPGFIAFSGRFVVISDTDEKLKTVLDRGKKDPAKSAAIDLSRSVQNSPMWIAFTFDGETRRKLREGLDMAGNQVPAMRDAAPAFDGAKGLTLTMDVVGANDLKLVASVMCKNAADAGKVKTGIEEGWKVAKGAIDGLMMFGGAPKGPEAKGIELMMKDLGKMTFSNSGDTASATLTFSNATIEELARLGKNAPFPPIGFNPPPPPKFDGGPRPPKFDGGPKPPVFDGGKKDFPKFDGGPKIPKGPTSFSAIQFNMGQTNEKVYQFQKGTMLKIDVHCGPNPNNQVEVSVLEGAAGAKAVFSDRQVGVIRSVNYMVTKTGTYSVRMNNIGPNVVPTCTVFVWENP